MAYSRAQLEALWKQAGGSPAQASTMAAIALAESRGNPRATHRNSNGTIDRGLWQINSSHGYGTSSFTPLQNARQAVAILASQGPGAWTTYTDGSYQRFLVAGRKRSTTRGKWGIFGGGFAGVDQGTDWMRAGPIPALGDGKVTYIGRSHIIEGGSYPVVVYELDSPPITGGSRWVYIAENFRPSVRVGQKIRKGQTVGIAAGSYPYIEQGWNASPTGWNPVAPLGSNPHAATGPGQHMLNYIRQQDAGQALPVGAAGVPTAQPGSVSRPRPGSSGGILDTIGGWFTGGGAEDVAGAVTGLPISSIGSLFEGAASAITSPLDFFKLAVWLIHPRTWLRVFEVLLGLTLMALSLRGLFLIFASRDTPAGFYTLGGAARSLHERHTRPAADTLIPGNSRRRHARRDRRERAAKAASLDARFGKVPF